MFDSVDCSDAAAAVRIQPVGLVIFPNSAKSVVQLAEQQAAIRLEAPVGFLVTGFDREVPVQQEGSCEPDQTWLH